VRAADIVPVAAWYATRSMSSTVVDAVEPGVAISIDQRVTLHGVAWAAYEDLLEMRGESSAVRITYLERELELMTPSREHEKLKKRLARIVEAFAEEKGLLLEGFGSWTIRSQALERGAEPDECYVVGSTDDENVEVPDIVIEVVWTSGGINKLDVYRGLGVGEVWVWRKGQLAFHLFEGGRYITATRSRLLPDLDSARVAICMAEASQTAAVATLRRALRQE